MGILENTEAGDVKKIRAALDDGGYLTGDYAVVGNLDSSVKSIEVDSIPDEPDLMKLRSYRLADGRWEFDEGRYQSLLAEFRLDELPQIKEQMIGRSKSSLSNYLAKAAIESNCHGGQVKRYSITSEKQQYLATMIMTTQAAQLSGIDYQPSWNATGEECTYDWTLEELQQLAFEMEAVVRPLVSRQQRMEVQIMQAESMEELQAIDISFGGEV